jgi:hypothetical protein
MLINYLVLMTDFVEQNKIFMPLRGLAVAYPGWGAEKAERYDQVNSKIGGNFGMLLLGKYAVSMQPKPAYLS